MATPTTDIVASTLQHLRPSFMDATARSLPLLGGLDRLGAIKEITGGQRIDHPTLLAEHSSISNLGGGGYGAVSTVVQDPMRLATFDWCNFAAPVVMTAVEKLRNKGDLAKVSILEGRLKSVIGMQLREMEKQFLAGTSTAIPDLQTLFGLGTNTGWLEEVAIASQANTVGGLAKASYPVGWTNQRADVADDAANNLIAAMDDVHINANTYSPDGEIDLIIASLASAKLYRAQLQPQERYMVADKTLGTGKQALAYANALLYPSHNLGGAGGGGTDYASMYFLNSKLITLYYDVDARQELSEPSQVAGYAADGYAVITSAQFAASHLSGLGLIYNAEL